MLIRAIALSLLGLGLLSAQPALADGMYCGSRLVSEGDSTGRVRGVCGDPAAANQRVELRTVRRYVDGPCVADRGAIRCGHVEEHTVQVTIDEWMYDFGPSVLVKTLTFEQGRLLRVESGGYGTKES